MTVEEARKEISSYCDTQSSCDDCPVFKVAKNGMCYSSASEKEIWRNYHAMLKAFNEPPAHGKTVRNTSLFDPVQSHHAICRELNALYARKNADYGDSFHKTYVEEGMAMARIRLSDKLERFKRLTKSNEQHVQDESVRDTLIDLANYAIMTVMELDGEKE